MAYCVDRKAKARLADFDRRECNKLRKTIMSDIGNPRLKKEVLDLIQQLQDGTLIKHHHHQKDTNDGHAIASSSSSSDSDIDDDESNGGDGSQQSSKKKKRGGKKSKGVQEAEEEAIQ
jgi:hypothetical protein